MSPLNISSHTGEFKITLYLFDNPMHATLAWEELIHWLHHWQLISHLRSCSCTTLELVWRTAKHWVNCCHHPQVLSGLTSVKMPLLQKPLNWSSVDPMTTLHSWSWLTHNFLSECNLTAISAKDEPRPCSSWSGTNTPTIQLVSALCINCTP